MTRMEFRMTRENMKLIVGLGNPGEKYEKTRHNLGFTVVERFLKDFAPVGKTIWENSAKFKSDIVNLEWQPRHGKFEKVILAKPKTYMNNSGLAVQLLTTYYLPRGKAGKLLTSDIWIIHDDIDLPLGVMKIRFGGGTAGHHGVDSILKALGTDKFWRFRLGTGTKNSRESARSSFARKKLKNVERFVLSSFREGEWGSVRKLIKRGSQAIKMALEKGLPASMNRFNTK